MEAAVLLRASVCNEKISYKCNIEFLIYFLPCREKGRKILSEFFFNYSLKLYRDAC